MTTNSDLNKRLEAFVAAQMNGGASAFAVWHKGEIIAKGGVGCNADDLFCVGSISKIYCAAAIMLLCDRGLVSLDTPVCEYLPRFKMADERYKKITLRMALNHSGGLPGTCIRLGFTREPIEQEKLDDCFYEYLEHSTLKAEPGSFSVYCNDGFQLAELVLKEVSGKSLQDFVRENLTEPIGALTTGYTNEAPKGKLVTVGEKREVINLAAAGGVQTSMADLCRFGSIFLHGYTQGILSEAALSEMHRAQGESLTDDLAAKNYGLGWDSVCANPAEVHFGANFIGVSSAEWVYDFGENALSKAGTSTQVKSLLFVIPKLEAVCAMALTLDAGCSRDALLPEILASALEERGISIRRRNAGVPISPQAADESFGGMYLSGPNLIECRVSGSTADIYACMGDMRIPMMENLVHGGEGEFYCEGHAALKLIHGRDRDYMLPPMESTGMATVAEKLPPLPELSPLWRSRMGTRWLCINGDPRDMALEENGAFAHFEILGGTENVPAFVAFSPDAHCFSATPFSADSEMRGGMFMDGPALSSRDSGEPVFLNNGELYYSGMRYINADTLPAAEVGEYSSDGVTAVALRLPEDRELTVESRDGTVFYYDAENKRVGTAVKGGYALLMGKASFTVKEI